ncbi:uncharacterized protein LOC143915873 [Arctopsyche grandis]|uniref:uncharacterized protein LOC143915873 n=1 Tax=Arctopsyche grandis TaxID=121162 RepID=UPI00406D6639
MAASSSFGGWMLVYIAFDPRPLYDPCRAQSQPELKKGIISPDINFKNDNENCSIRSTRGTFPRILNHNKVVVSKHGTNTQRNELKVVVSHRLHHQLDFWVAFPTSIYRMRPFEKAGQTDEQHGRARGVKRESSTQFAAIKCNETHFTHNRIIMDHETDADQLASGQSSYECTICD